MISQTVYDHKNSLWQTVSLWIRSLQHLFDFLFRNRWEGEHGGSFGYHVDTDIPDASRCRGDAPRHKETEMMRNDYVLSGSTRHAEMVRFN